MTHKTLKTGLSGLDLNVRFATKATHGPQLNISGHYPDGSSAWFKMGLPDA